MKNLKKLLPLFAFVLGLGLVFTQSAFTAKADKKATASHYYILNEAGDEYTYFDSVKPSEGDCDEGPEYKCIIGMEGFYTTPLDPTDLPEVPTDPSANDGWYNTNP